MSMLHAQQARQAQLLQFVLCVDQNMPKEAQRSIGLNGNIAGQARVHRVGSRDTVENDFDLAILVEETFRCTGSSSVKRQ